jgi:hypothetical protein
MREVVVLAVLAACGSHDSAQPAKHDEATHEQKPQKLDHLQMALPAGWTSQYNADTDQWLFTTPPLADGRTANARIERAASNAVASPDAYLAQRKKAWDTGTQATIEKRQGVKDGFAMTVSVTPAADPEHPKRETYVVRQLGNVWYQCLSEWVPDDATRDQLVALCRSIRL